MGQTVSPGGRPQKARHQFDLDHLQIAPVLQGVALAPFSKRVLAYGLDWVIIVLAVRYLPVAFALVVLYLAAKSRLLGTLRNSRAAIDSGLSHMDSVLERQGAQRLARRRFRRFLRVYIHVLMLAAVVSLSILAIFLVAGLLMPETVGQVVKSQLGKLAIQPFQGVVWELQLFSGLAGGLIYFALFTWKWRGQTPGKKALGIRVVKLNGKNIRLWDSFERVSGYTASASLFMLGFLQYFWDRNHQTTHDKIVETVVVDDASFASVSIAGKNPENAGQDMA